MVSVTNSLVGVTTIVFARVLAPPRSRTLGLIQGLHKCRT